MTAITPEQLRALADEHAQEAAEYVRDRAEKESQPEYGDVYEYEDKITWHQKTAAALRAAADQLEAVQDRERIDRAVTPVLVNASNYPSAVVPHLLGQDSGPLRRKVTEAVLAVLTADTAPQEK